MPQLTKFFATLFALGLFIASRAQQPEIKTTDEPESAEVFLEEYTDEFQELFFEALKQKGIGNYDRAIRLLLDAKKNRQDLSILDFEIAKLYYHNKKFSESQSYALGALKALPQDYWYLDLFMQILDVQSSSIYQFEADLPLDQDFFLKNLAKYYVSSGAIQTAEELLKKLRQDEDTQRLKGQIEALKGVRNSFLPPAEVTNSQNPTEDLKIQIDNAIKRKDWNVVLELATEGIDTFPVQPYFYLQHGKASFELAKYLQAIETLELGTTFVRVEDKEQKNKFFELMAASYEKLGDSKRAAEYRKGVE